MALDVGPALSCSSCTIIALCRLARPRRRYVRCEAEVHLGSSEPVFAGGARFRRPRPSPGVHRVAAAGPQAGGAPRLGFFDLTCNE